MKAIKIYKHIIQTNLFNINNKRKRKLNDKKAKKKSWYRKSKTLKVYA